MLVRFNKMTKIKDRPITLCHLISHSCSRKIGSYGSDGEKDHLKMIRGMMSLSYKKGFRRAWKSMI